MKNWDSINVFFDELNRNDVKYLVLRNYEYLYDTVQSLEHDDIDVLCENLNEFIECADCVPRLNRNDFIHYKIMINGKEIPIDIRSIGDGYYCGDWEREMLKTRCYYGDIPICSNENDFYSLLYHALIQKKCITEEYRNKLSEKARILGINEQIELDLLNCFMKRKGYKYTYPMNPFGIFNENVIPKEMIEKNSCRKIKRLIVNVLRVVKRKILLKK